MDTNILSIHKIKFKKEISQSLIKPNYKKQYQVTLVRSVNLVIIFENFELQNRVLQLRRNDNFNGGKSRCGQKRMSKKIRSKFITRNFELVFIVLS